MSWGICQTRPHTLCQGNARNAGEVASSLLKEFRLRAASLINTVTSEDNVTHGEFQRRGWRRGAIQSIRHPGAAGGDRGRRRRLLAVQSLVVGPALSRSSG